MVKFGTRILTNSPFSEISALLGAGKGGGSVIADEKGRKVRRRCPGPEKIRKSILLRKFAMVLGKVLRNWLRGKGGGGRGKSLIWRRLRKKGTSECVYGLSEKKTGVLDRSAQMRFT